MTAVGFREAVAIRELALSPAHLWCSTGAACPPEDVSAFLASLFHSPGRERRGAEQGRESEKEGEEGKERGGKGKERRTKRTKRRREEITANT